MAWHKQISDWLFLSEENEFRIGERSVAWIDSFKKDIERWNFPIELFWKNPVLVSGKVEVFLRKRKAA